MSREIRSPVYQIDFTAVDSGKRIASSKRRIRWRFGFTNQDALAAGDTGTACRGEEHDITLIWSLTSGKRLVLADGQEVHYSNSRSQIFDFSWTMRGNHVLKVVAHSTTPMNAHPNFRQYDFFVDGMSFFSMPKVYRLGLTVNTPIQEPTTLALAHSSRRSNAYGNYAVGSGGSVGANAHGYQPTRAPPKPGSIVEIETPHNEQEEEAYLREAIKASLSNQSEGESQPNYASGNASFGDIPSNQQKEDNSLIDFMSEPGPVPAPTPGTLDAFAIVPSPVPPASVYAPSPYAFAGFPQPVQAQTAPAVAPPSNLYSPAPPAFNMAPPAPTMAPPVPVAVAPVAPPPVAPPPAAPFVPHAPVATTPFVAPPTEAAPALTMAPQSTGLGTDANAAYAKFASMDQFDLVKPTNGAPSAAINPFDEPAQPTLNQPAPTLAGMKAMNQGQGEKKEVMKNAMVSIPNQAGNWGAYAAPAGAPPMGQLSVAPTMGGMQAQGQQNQFNTQFSYQQQPPVQTMPMHQYGMQQGQPFQQQNYGQQSQPQQDF